MTSVAVCLLGYGVIVGVWAPGMLGRATRNGMAPRLGIAAWAAAMISVPAAGVGALVLVLVELARSWNEVGELLTGCLATLQLVVRGGHGVVLQIGLLVLAGLTALALGTLGGRVVTALRRSRSRSQEHALSARIAAAGMPAGPGGALVLDTDQRSVYCVAAQTPTIVITRGALAALDAPQLAAVLAHERAHLTGHHHLLVCLTAALARVLPRTALFTAGAVDVARLVEMCADDAAARRYGADTVVDALLALALPAPPTPPAAALPVTALPVTALAACGTGTSGSGVAERVDRLLRPIDPARARIGLVATLGGVLAGPVLAGALLVLVPAVCAVAPV